MPAKCVIRANAAGLRSVGSAAPATIRRCRSGQPAAWCVAATAGRPALACRWRAGLGGIRGGRGRWWVVCVWGGREYAEGGRHRYAVRQARTCCAQAKQTALKAAGAFEGIERYIISPAGCSPCVCVAGQNGEPAIRWGAARHRLFIPNAKRVRVVVSVHAYGAGAARVGKESACGASIRMALINTGILMKRHGGGGAGV